MPEQTMITSHSTEHHPIGLCISDLTEETEERELAVDVTQYFLTELPDVFGSMHDSTQVEESVEQKFRRLTDEWRETTMLSSSGTEIISHPAYLRIIGMGEKAVHLILRELQQREGHWFLALRSITEQNPVSPEDAGDMKRMAEAWIRWGHQNGYL